ncbi:hypothetical protein R3P38DRAFT_2772166 [Favolaschia claudopus]|uniref:Uncharacterized protein n=1 Tax=Favolaschia claudopus TaxID=2862362 RepID=A0AAW0A1I7_9AGAR
MTQLSRSFVPRRTTSTFVPLEMVKWSRSRAIWLHGPSFILQHTLVTGVTVLHNNGLPAISAAAARLHAAGFVIALKSSRANNASSGAESALTQPKAEEAGDSKFELPEHNLPFGITASDLAL